MQVFQCYCLPYFTLSFMPGQDKEGVKRRGGTFPSGDLRVQQRLQSAGEQSDAFGEPNSLGAAASAEGGGGFTQRS